MGIKKVLFQFVKFVGIKNSYLQSLMLVKDKLGIRSKFHDELKLFYAPLIKNQSLVFDIGANIGSRTLIFQELAGRVIALEPNPDLFLILKKRFGSNGKIVTVKRGCAAESGITSFYLGSNHLVSSFSKKFISFKKSIGEDRQWTKEVKVDLTTLDLLIAEYGLPQFCKIDVEGFEWPVISGLSQKIPLLSFEFTLPVFEEETYNCLMHLSELGYMKFNIVLGEGVRFHLDDWVNMEQLKNELKNLNYSGPQNYGDIYAR